MRRMLLVTPLALTLAAVLGPGLAAPARAGLTISLTPAGNLEAGGTVAIMVKADPGPDSPVPLGLYNLQFTVTSDGPSQGSFVIPVDPSSSQGPAPLNDSSYIFYQDSSSSPIYPGALDPGASTPGTVITVGDYSGSFVDHDLSASSLLTELFLTVPGISPSENLTVTLTGSDLESLDHGPYTVTNPGASVTIPVTVHPTPEPGTIILVLTGGVALGVSRLLRGARRGKAEARA